VPTDNTCLVLHPPPERYLRGGELAEEATCKEHLQVRQEGVSLIDAFGCLEILEVTP
jgi:hypothetical protein